MFEITKLAGEHFVRNSRKLALQSAEMERATIGDGLEDTGLPAAHQHPKHDVGRTHASPVSSSRRCCARAPPAYGRGILAKFVGTRHVAPN